MMQVTSVEFQRNPGRYLDLALAEDIWIFRDGMMIARLTKPKEETKISALDALTGILRGKVSEDIDRRSIREERLKRYEADD